MTKPRYVRRRKKRTFRKNKTFYATAKSTFKIALNQPAQQFTVPTGNSAVDTFGVSFGDIIANDIDAFIDLYDEIKITGFSVEFRPRGNVANAGLTQDQGFQWYSVIDYTDLNNLAFINDALEYANVRKHQSWRVMKRFVPVQVPVTTRDVNNTPYLKIEKPQWMQTKSQTIAGTVFNNANIAHLGMKIITETNESDEDVIFDVYIKTHCLFRNKQ